MQVLSGMEKRKLLERWEDVEVTYWRKQEKSPLKVTFLGGPKLLRLKLFIGKLSTTGVRDAAFIVCPESSNRLVCIRDIHGLSSFGIQTQVLD